MSESTTSNSPLLLTNGALTFAPDCSGLQTNVVGARSTWAPSEGGTPIELPQIDLWIGQLRTGGTDVTGEAENVDQTLTPQTGVLESHFKFGNAFWAVTTVINPFEPEIAFRIERTVLAKADDAETASYSADTPPTMFPAVERRAAADAPKFGIVLDAPRGSDATVNLTKPGSHTLAGSNTYLVAYTAGNARPNLNAALSVTGGAASTLAETAVAVIAEGGVLDVVIRFSADDAEVVGASANLATVAAAAAASWGQTLGEPHGPGLH